MGLVLGGRDYKDLVFMRSLGPLGLAVGDGAL